MTDQTPTVAERLGRTQGSRALEMDEHDRLVMAGLMVSLSTHDSGSNAHVLQKSMQTLYGFIKPRVDEMTQQERVAWEQMLAATRFLLWEHAMLSDASWVARSDTLHNRTMLMRSLGDNLAAFNRQGVRLDVGDADGTVVGPMSVVLPALSCVVANAARAAHGQPDATVRLERVGETAVAVVDNGPGVDDPDALFTEGASGAGSTGMGLAMARRLLSNVGATIAYDPDHTAGCRIVVDWGAGTR
jgi:K+-sensing histidine kinase KdpD